MSEEYLQDCACSDWKVQIEKVNAPIMFLYARNPNTYKYDGKQFIYCPWCGTKRELKP